MTTQDYFPLAVECFGPQHLKGSKPPHSVLFDNGSVSVDLIRGLWEVIEPNGRERVEVDGKAVLLLGGSLTEITEALRKQNGSKGWREALARQTIAETEAQEAKERANHPRLPKITNPEVLERARERTKKSKKNRGRT
jgi:hypothetical protein